MLHLLHRGSCRTIWLYGAAGEFQQWLSRLQRPPSEQVLEKLEWLADVPSGTLIRLPSVWKRQRGTTPPIYAVKHDQARLYCCLRGEDIVILDWDTKKSAKANPLILRRAEQRAAEVERTGQP